MTHLEALLHALLREPGALEQVEMVHAQIVREARMAAEGYTYLKEATVSSILASIPDGQDFVVVFRKVNDDIREMQCTLDREQAVTKKRHLDTFCVWDTEKNAPRTFRLDRVYSIQIENLPTKD